MERVGEDRRPAPKSFPDEPGDRRGLLDRLAAGEGDDDPPAGLLQAPLRLVDGLVPGDGLESAASNSAASLRYPVGGVEVRIAEAPLVAEPALVDLGVVPRKDPRHLALPRRRPGVAAHRAQAADRRHVLDLPGARAKAIRRRRERPDRAELEDVAREVG